MIGRRRFLNEEQKKSVRDDYKKGLSWIAIKKKHGISFGTISKILNLQKNTKPVTGGSATTRRVLNDQIDEMRNKFKQETENDIKAYEDRLNENFKPEIFCGIKSFKPDNDEKIKEYKKIIDEI